MSVQAGAGTLEGEPKEQHSGMTSYLQVADFDEADFPVELTLNWHQEGTYKMKAAKTSGTAPGNLKAVTYSMAMRGTGVNRFLQPGAGSARGI
ncbi:MAG: hypothetical protein ACLTW9_12340 [Enterocloster sp.]